MNEPNERAHRVETAFVEHFGSLPTVVVRAPGRVNLIGEHTDYNDGFVLPLAIEREVRIALRPRTDRRVHLYSLDFDEHVTVDLDRLDRSKGGWESYLQGTAWALEQTGFSLTGWEGTLGGDVPLGAGLSSSAALELAIARAFAEIADWSWDAPAMARVGQLAENGWVGVQCGIMDQMISAVGQKGSAVLIDCRSLETTSVPLPNGLSVVILDTGTRRGLVDSAYNERRQQCEAAASFFGVSALREVSVHAFAARENELDEITRRRARHVITENKRVMDAANAMRSGDAAKLGKLMRESHASLRDDFEVSSPALDAMVEIADRDSVCFGARMTGAGFGGCAVAIVDVEAAPEFATRVAAAYKQETGNHPSVYITAAADGAARVG